MSGRMMMMVRDALADGACRTTAELAALTGLPTQKVANAAGRLILRGLAERVERGCYRLTEAGVASARSGEALRPGPRGPHGKRKAVQRQSFRQRAWAAMRMCGKFTAPEIMRLAARPGERGGSLHNLYRYLRALEAARYVHRLPVKERGTRPGSTGFARWRVMRDTGPLAPAYSVRDAALFDRNTGETIHLREGRHEQAA